MYHHVFIYFTTGYEATGSARSRSAASLKVSKSTKYIELVKTEINTSHLLADRTNGRAYMLQCCVRHL